MSLGRLRANWDAMAHVLARMENAWMRSGKTDRPCQLWEVHPFRERADYVKHYPRGDITSLKGLLDGGRFKSNQSR